MSAAKARPTATSAAKSAATRAAKGAAKGAAKSAARTAAKGAAKGAAAGGERIGRGTRWTEEQVSLLLTTVRNSDTAKDAFETVARELGKSAGTVQQKYYNLQKANGGGAPAGGAKRRGRPPGSTNRATSAGSSARAGGGTPNAAALRSMTVDELVGLATSVKGEIDRRRSELDAASKLLAS